MVRPGPHVGLLDSKCSSCRSHSQFLIIGLILAYCASLSSQASTTMRCSSQDISSRYQHCGTHTDGVHDLDCFGKFISRSRSYFKCVWKPGSLKSEKTYTLVVQQQGRRYCRAHHNITEIPKEIIIFQSYNMTAEVFENSESINCTRAAFRGSPNKMLRCGPPSNVSFSRESGRLLVNVSWFQEDRKDVMNYLVRYKTTGSRSWNKSPVRCQTGGKCAVENVNASVVYTVQIQCETNERCSQCPWSQEYTVPPELTTQPVIISVKETDMAEKKGQRLLSLAWKFSAAELCEYYRVTIRKASGEAPWQRLNTTQPQIRLLLSHSAFQLNISAVNNASTSPAARRDIPQREDQPSAGAGKVNVTVHNKTSFSVSWRDNLIRSYECFSVEWMKKGHKAAAMSFHQKKNNSRTLNPLSEPLEPYERYSLTLHTRPYKETCNLKHVNNSESSYASTHFYLTEGAPVGAPNISSHNVTLTSVVLLWSSIPEQDVRGFLLGYIIYYTEYHHRGTTTERNITVDAALNSYELKDLKGGTAYEAQISGFTRAGAGVRSQACLFKTNSPGFSILKNGVIAGFAVVAAILLFGSPLIKRAKVILWPSIPNPGKSNAMQKIERPCELELLESITTLKVEEWDTNSLQIVEKDDPASTSVFPLLHASEDEEDSPETIANWVQTDSEDATGDIPAETSPDAQQTKPHGAPVVFSSDYTTMEMFQRGMAPGVGANSPVTKVLENTEDTDSTVGKSRLDYIRQLSGPPSARCPQFSEQFGKRITFESDEVH